MANEILTAIIGSISGFISGAFITLQHFGVGIQIDREALAGYDNPPQEFEFDLGSVMAIIRKKERI